MLTVEDWTRALPGCENGTAVDLSAADAVLASPCRCLYVGVAGDVKVDMLGSGQAITFKAAPVGLLNVRATKVYKVGTTATNLVALR
jgi:hypothetical protein